MPDPEGLRTRVIRESALRKLFGDVAAPARLREYTLLEYIGGGGMGDVFAAYDPALDRKIAIKVLRVGDWSGDERELYERRLVREARAMARLAHPNVNTVYQAGKFEDRLFIAMEYIGGGTLREWLGREERAWQEIVAMFAQAGEGLCAAHEAGLIHRDFKPDNVLVGEDGRARVTDFGLVVSGELREHAAGDEDSGGGSEEDSEPSLQGALTGRGQAPGTPAYMAPEQLAGEETDPRTDIYAFCVALYEGLYGERPFSEDPALAETEREAELARLKREQAVRFPDSPEVPFHVRDVLACGLRADPSERFGSMRALLSALLRDPWRRRRRVLAAAGGAVTVLALVVFGYLAFEPRESACPSAGAEALELWGPATSERITRAFLAAKPELGGPGIADAALARVGARLPAYSRALADAYEHTCHAGARRQRSAELVDLTNRCLDYRLAAAKTLIAQLERADADMVSRSVAAMDRLPDIADCSNPSLVRRADLVNRTQQERARVAALETRVAKATVQISLGRYEALDELEAVVKAARQTDSPRVLGRAELARARAHSARGWTQNARLAGRAALEHAERAGDDSTVIQTLIHLIPLEARNSGRATVYNLKRILDAKIARHGGDRKLELSSKLAWLPTLLSDRISEAYELARRLLPQVEQVFGDPSLELGRLLVALGHMESLLNRHDSAGTSLKRAIDVLAAVLGAEHPTVATAREKLAAALYYTHDADQGLAQLDLIARHLGRHELSPSKQVTLAMYRARLIALVHGREEEALALLDRALTIRGVGADGEPRVPRWYYGGAMETKAEILFRMGRLEGVDALIEKSIELRKPLWVPGLWLVGALARQIHVEVAAGTCKKIRPRLAAIAPLVKGYRPDEGPPPENVIPLAHCDLVAGRTTGVVARFRSAIASMKKRGTRPLWLARAELYLARAIAKTGGDRAEIRSLAESARGTLEKANDRLHLRQLEAILRQRPR